MPAGALLCPECGAEIPRKKKTQTRKGMDSFSMPFLSAPPPSEEEPGTDIDPEASQREAEIRRNKRVRRVVAGSVALVLAAAITLYIVFFGGYKLAVFRYVKGADYASGRMYLALVPDTFLDYLEDTYSTTKRAVRDMISDYWVYWNENYGTEGRMSYDITSRVTCSADTIASIESELEEDYGIRVQISKGVVVNLSIDDGGSKQREQATLIKIGMKWCCVEAMEQIDYICEYDGYDVW